MPEHITRSELLRLPAIERERPERRRLVSTEPALRFVLWMLSLAIVLSYLALASWAYARVEVPQLAELTEAESSAALIEAGLEFGSVTRQFSEYPLGEVIEQSPDPGMIAQRGDVVDLVVSAGLGGFTIPNVISEDVADARATLERLGLRVVVEPLQSEAPAGSVLLTVPPSGTRFYADEDLEHARIIVYVATPVVSAGLVNYQLDGLRVAIEPRFSATAAGDVSFDVARRLSSLFEAAEADVSITRTSTEREIDYGEYAARAARISPELHIILTVRDEGPEGILVRSAQTDEESTARAIYERMLDNQLLAHIVRADLAGQAGERNSIEIVLGSTANAADIEYFYSSFWRDHVARAIYMAASPQFSLDWE